MYSFLLLRSAWRRGLRVRGGSEDALSPVGSKLEMLVLSIKRPVVREIGS